jgi:SH3-like domain-containing protein
MTRKAPTRTIVTLLAWCAIALAPALAQAQPAKQMVSVKGSIQNTILWELQKGYPLQVTQRKNRWLKVKDFEGDTGWVAASLTGRQPHHIVKVHNANVRSGPGTQHRIVSKATYGELVRTREKRGSWVRVERSEGKSGWISKKLLWGW